MSIIDKLESLIHPATGKEAPFPPVPGMEKIQHLVILMMENRSFDHYLGGLKFDPTYPYKDIVDGLPDPAAFGTWNLNTRLYDQYYGYPDLPHGPVPQQANNQDSANFLKNFQATTDAQSYMVALRNEMEGDRRTEAEIQAELDRASRIPTGYYTRNDVPVLYSLADNFLTCDRWFSAELSSTWPNRKYLHSGVRDDDNDTHTLPDPPQGFKTKLLWDTFEDQRDSNGNLYTWRSYHTDLPFLAFWYMFAAFHLKNFSSVVDFVEDCREDRLPTISVVDPAFSLCDDHPTHDIRLGQKFLGLVVDALTTSESWDDTALIVTYDENGGFFDHVKPPAPIYGTSPADHPEDTPRGFRVPSLIISPYAKNGVCSTTFDHTSILKSIAVRWGIQFDPQQFGTRFLTAENIWENCFDFNRTPIPRGIYTEQPGKGPAYKDFTWEQGIHDLVTMPQGDLEALLERVFLLPGLKSLDQRAKVFDNLNAMERNIVTLKRMLPT